MRITLIVPLLLFACGDPPPSEYPEQKVYVEDTTLGPEDVFEVRIYREEDLSGTYAVSSEGTINFPLIGEVLVSGKSPTEVERELRDRLADGYLKSPQVSLLVKEYNSKSISVLGEVRTPGSIKFSEGMTIIEAIAQAGGFSELAKKNSVVVTRSVGDEQASYTIPVDSIKDGKAKNFYVRPGDTIDVPRRVW